MVTETLFQVMFIILFLLLAYESRLSRADSSGKAYTLISRLQTECETEALSIGTLLSDHYNSLDEDTEWDVRVHHDFLVEHLGFAGWIQTGTWHSGGVTPLGFNAHELHNKGGWAGHKNARESSYWALENKWVYMMGDSTKRQLWATMLSGFQSNDFERNAKEWTREHCARQYPHRKEHPSGGYFPEEGWGGKCGNNEVTCDLSGFGEKGLITFDWKHFPWEDYDQWLFGETGKWSKDAERRPDILTIQVGVHTCFHAHIADNHPLNDTLIRTHENDLPILMKNVRQAIDRHSAATGQPPTEVIIVMGGRLGNPDPALERCSWRFNRIAAREAHRHGFAVFEREEIERRLLYKSEAFAEVRTMKPLLHLENPGPPIVVTSLLGMISCLVKNSTDHFAGTKPFEVFRSPALVSTQSPTLQTTP